MDFERTDLDFQPPPNLDRKPRISRAKSPTRMRYEAEITHLLKQNGDLEQIRQKLGLSRRKICQLLLVDPSAWTRWTSPGGSAPPHIHRALDWYISILEKDPEYRRLSHRFADWLGKEKDLEGRLRHLEARVPTPLSARFGEWRTWASAFCVGVGVTLLLLGLWSKLT